MGDVEGLPIVLAIPVHSSRGLEGDINAYMFPSTIRLAKREEAPTRTPMPRSWYARSDECTDNITRSVGRHDVVIYAVTSFLQISPGRGSTASPLAFGVEGVTFFDVMVRSVLKKENGHTKCVEMSGGEAGHE